LNNLFMKSRLVHYFSGIFIAFFVGLHLFNHAWSILGAEAHIRLMNVLRLLYRNIFIETLLLVAVILQIFSGIRLFREVREQSASFFEKLHIYTGLYLAVFLLIHVSAVLVGRLVLRLDTNFYFGVAGLNTFPFNLFFVPYYGLAIFSFWGHVAATHHKKMKRTVFKISPNHQAKTILWGGLILMIFIFYGLTNGFKGFGVPQAYKILVGG